MKSILRMVACLAAGFVMATAASSAQAQRPAHYYPSRPTFSPYLLYRQLNLTGIPNYYSYVQPATQYRDFLIRGQTRPAAARRESLIGAREIANMVERRLEQRPSTGIGAPAIPARYGDYSHYYNAPAAGAR